MSATEILFESSTQNQTLTTSNPNVYTTHSMVKKKVKESRNRPGVAQRVPGGLPDFMKFGT